MAGPPSAICASNWAFLRVLNGQVNNDLCSCRTLAYSDKADGWDYSVEAARAGAAHSYVYHGHPSARADEIATAEQEAKAAGWGLWAPPCFGQTTSVPI